MSDARRFVELDGPFAMYRGGELAAVTIAYETWGELSGRGDNALLLFTGMSPSAHAASSADDPTKGWWEFMIGPDKPIDTNRFFVICINSLGSCFGSTGPASIDAATGQRYRLTFPKLSVEDIVAAGRQACRARAHGGRRLARRHGRHGLRADVSGHVSRLDQPIGGGERDPVLDRFALDPARHDPRRPPVGRR
ncbi:MAG: hypothetical protein BRD57_02445 [Proteobacteria bacterium SW_6_67_9]|nr:MAG: hypothetical protein BRD57_02445 [Proteobacteria bacterium SW_6_67_9]